MKGKRVEDTEARAKKGKSFFNELTSYYDRELHSKKSQQSQQGSRSVEHDGAGKDESFESTQ